MKKEKQLRKEKRISAKEREFDQLAKTIAEVDRMEHSLAAKSFAKKQKQLLNKNATQRLSRRIFKVSMFARLNHPLNRQMVSTCVSWQSENQPYRWNISTLLFFISSVLILLFASVLIHSFPPPAGLASVRAAALGSALVDAYSW